MKNLTAFKLDDNEKALLVHIARWRKTTEYVLQNTFYMHKNEAGVHARVHRLCKKMLLEKRSSGIDNPRKVIVLAHKGKEVCEHETGMEINKYIHNPATLKHNELEQITDFWVRKLYPNIKRTSVGHSIKIDGVVLKRTPDFRLKIDKNIVNLECELTLKAKSKYGEIVSNCIKDGVKNIIFVTPNHEFSILLAKRIPPTSMVKIIDLHTLINNVQNSSKISPFSVGFLLQKLELDDEQSSLLS